MTTDARQPPEVMDVTGWMVTSDGASIPYRVKGAGPALVLIHGWSQSGAMFQHQLDALSERYKVIVPDVRGHGDAPEPAGGVRMARLARDLDELLAQLGLDRVSLLGWSMGVSVIWSFIDLFGTAKIDRLVFVDQPSVLTILPGEDAAQALEAGALFTVPQLYDLHAALCGPEGQATRAGFVAGMVTKSIAPPVYEWILAENARTPLKLAADLLLSHCTHDWRDVLARVDRPTLVIGGAVSHVATVSQRFVQSQVNGAVYHEFGADEGGAHFPFLEAPGAFNRVVSSFLDDR